MKPLITAVTCCLAFLFLTCSNPSSGNGSDVGNPVISGILVNQNGTRAANAVVTMVPVDYVPSIALLKTSLPRTVACTTDSKGEYRIYSIDSLCYNFEARRDTCGVFHDSVKVVLDSQEHRLDTMTLASLGRVYGVTKMPGQNDTNQVRVTLYIPGTQRITKPAIGGAFMFDQVPAGKYQMIIDPTLNTYNVKVMDINLNAGQDLNLDTVVLGVYVPDTIQINQTWVYGTWGPGKVYEIMCQIAIPTSQTLTILPGTTVKFYGPLQLTFGGAGNNNLFVRGKPDSLITFEPELSPGKDYGFIQYPEDTASDTTLLMNWVIFNGMGGTDLGGSHGVVLSNCVFVNCATAIGIDGTKGVISNCIFWKNNRAIFNISDPDTNISIINCVFLGNDTCFSANIVKSNFTYCLFYNNLSTPPDSISPNCLFTDPLFVSLDTLSSDFHLQSGSPCLGAGLNGSDIGLYDSH